MIGAAQGIKRKYKRQQQQRQKRETSAAPEQKPRKQQQQRQPRPAAKSTPRQRTAGVIKTCTTKTLKSGVKVTRCTKSRAAPAPRKSNSGRPAAAKKRRQQQTTRGRGGVDRKKITPARGSRQPPPKSLIYKQLPSGLKVAYPAARMKAPTRGYRQQQQVSGRGGGGGRRSTTTTAKQQQQEQRRQQFVHKRLLSGVEVAYPAF